MRDRTFGRSAGTKDFSPASGYGSWNDGSGWKPSPHCPKENIKQEGFCGFNPNEVMQFSPQILQGSAFLQAETDIGDTSFFGTAIYSYTRSLGIIAPAPDIFGPPKSEGQRDYRIPADIANRNWNLGATGPVSILYRLVDEKGAGPRKRFEDTHFYQVQGRVTHPFADTMEFETDLNISGSHYLSDNENYANKETLYKRIEQNKFKIFSPSDKKSDISSATYEPWQNTRSHLISLEPRVTGELTEIGNEPLYFVLGVLGAWQAYSETLDKITLEGKQWGGGAPSEGDGNRWFSAIYGELSSLVWNEMLEVQLAARTDYYNDFGVTDYELDVPFMDNTVFPLWTSPQLKLTFQPIDELKFRTSLGLGFKAPTLAQLYHSETTGYLHVIDRARCLNYDKGNPECNTTEHQVFVRSNKDLKPETYQSFTAGVIFSPIEEFSFSIDYYRNNTENKIQNPLNPRDGKDLLRDAFILESKKGKEVVEKELKQSISRTASDQATGDIGKVGTEGHVVQMPFNAGYRKERGIDLEADVLVTNLGIPWDLSFGVQHFHVLYMERQVNRHLDKETPVPYPTFIEDWFGIKNPDPHREHTHDTWQGYPRWRNRATLGFLSKDKKYSFYLVAHNIPGQLKTNESKPEDEKDKSGDHLTDHYFQLDLIGVFALTQTSSLTVGIRNLWDAERPLNTENFEPANGGYVNAYLYSIEGRTIDVRYTYNF